MSSQAYYRDRLGFDPGDQSGSLKRARTERPFDPKAKQAYEENLSKFKGIWNFFIESIGTVLNYSFIVVCCCDFFPACDLTHPSNYPPFLCC